MRAVYGIHLQAVFCVGDVYKIFRICGVDRGFCRGYNENGLEKIRRYVC